MGVQSGRWIVSFGLYISSHFFKTRKNIISMSGVFFVRKFISVSFNVSLTEGCQLSDQDCGFDSGSPALCILNSDDKTMHVLGGLCLSDDLACVSL